MSEDKIKGSVITNLDQSLQGRAAGVTAVATSGAPGSASSIRVRGQATINAGAEPLYVIDGVIVQGEAKEVPILDWVTPLVMDQFRRSHLYQPLTRRILFLWKF